MSVRVDDPNNNPAPSSSCYLSRHPIVPTDLYYSVGVQVRDRRQTVQQVVVLCNQGADVPACPQALLPLQCYLTDALESVGELVVLLPNLADYSSCVVDLFRVYNQETRGGFGGNWTEVLLPGLVVHHTASKGTSGVIYSGGRAVKYLKNSNVNFA